MPCSLQAQHISFCEKVSADGTPINKRNIFMIDLGIEPVYIHLEKLDSLKTTKIIYKIYFINPEDSPIYEGELKEKVDPAWTWCWKEVYFKEEGLYNILILDAKSDTITSDFLKIRKKSCW
jgi:hypothetical protein